MKVLKAYSFLVHPAKNQEVQPNIGGTEIDVNGDVGILLASAFIRADTDFSLEISFNMSSGGKQENSVRNAIVALIEKTNISNARKLAEMLQLVTTNRSGLGLFFVVTGQSDDGFTKKVYLSRFPADNGIVAEENENQLQVELLQQVFMKNAHAYKAVIYQGGNISSDFWHGRAIDKQVQHTQIAISGYWIQDFLQSDFKTTAALGTRRLAQALKETISGTNNLDVKSELTALATIAKNFNNKVISIRSLTDTFNLSEAAASALHRTLEKPGLAFTQFKFSASEFAKHIKFKQVQLDNGAVLTAPTGKFDKVFKQTKTEGLLGTVSFTTQGVVVDESLKKTKQ